MTKFGRTKFKHWEYESEHRLFFDLARAKIESPLYTMFFLPFETDVSLKEVVLGCRYESGKHRELEENLRNDGVTITTARPAFQAFEMTSQRAIKMQFHL